MSVNRSASLDILEVIDEHGLSTPQIAYERLGLDPTYVRRQFRELDEEGYLNRLAHGTYELTEKGKRTVNSGQLAAEKAD